ncbi:phage portal protein [Lederbergia galactosidilytica]|uniref:Portal protein n=1 Tax=Lederbergia galactosidilytica TaxID=217031 RepID=A0A177ZYV5_9BACI|nr:phage portal protein [Lederbergia galactosidilytica]OAK72679.1 portal protein [Lederbergia galactosidilytica]
MGLRNRFSNYVYNKLEKRMNQIEGGSVRFPYIPATEDNILQSSDVYELLQDISNQLMLAEIVVEDEDGNEIRNDPALKVLKNPNSYLTQSEFIKLMTNYYLLTGEVFPLLNDKQIHLAAGVYTELDKNLIEHFKIGSVEIPPDMIRHVKNIGTNHLKGVGLLDLGRNTLEGVMSAEKVLTDKYTKGGLLAFLLKLDAHINPANGAQSKLIKAILDQLEQIDDSRSVKMIPLGKGYEIEAMKSPVEDEKILSYLNVYKKDLGKFLSINVDTYQALIKVDFEKAMMYLHNKAVRPIMKNFEDHLSLLFYGQNSKKRIKFKINVLDFVTYSTKTNIGYNIVRTGITSPDNVADMLGFEKQNTPETQAIYISNDLSKIGEKKATDDSLKGGDDNDEKEGNTDS